MPIRPPWPRGHPPYLRFISNTRSIRRVPFATWPSTVPIRAMCSSSREEGGDAQSQNRLGIPLFLHSEYLDVSFRVGSLYVGCELWLSAAATSVRRGEAKLHPQSIV